jgi:hypothetical protein
MLVLLVPFVPGAFTAEVAEDAAAVALAADAVALVAAPEAEVAAALAEEDAADALVDALEAEVDALVAVVLMLVSKLASSEKCVVNQVTSDDSHATNVSARELNVLGESARLGAVGGLGGEVKEVVMAIKKPARGGPSLS